MGMGKEKLDDVERRAVAGRTGIAGIFADDKGTYTGRDVFARVSGYDHPVRRYPDQDTDAGRQKSRMTNMIILVLYVIYISAIAALLIGGL